MTTPDLSAILEDLAAGRIDPAEASRRIEAAKGAAGEPAAPPRRSAGPDAGSKPEPTNEQIADGSWRAHARENFGDDPVGQRRGAGTRGGAGRVDDELIDDGPVPPSDRQTSRTKGVERVTIRAVGRRVRIVGEPRVATASVDGAHVLRRSGSTLEISSDGEIGASIDGFTLLRPPRSLEDVRNLGLGKELFIRVNPNLIVDVELTAGSLTTENVRFLGKVRVTAGGAKITGINEAHDVLVQAGQATVKGSITTGRSRVRCESGSLNVQLADDSNVTVRAEAQLGKVAWSGGHSGAGDEVVMGNGSARLDVGVVMGHCQVKVGSEEDK